jgi:hypothetical protein
MIFAVDDNLAAGALEMSELRKVEDTVTPGLNLLIWSRPRKLELIRKCRGHFSLDGNYRFAQEEGIRAVR